MGRRHRGMDRPGVRQVPEGSGEQGKMEKSGCKIIRGAPTTLAVKGLMMMIMTERTWFNSRSSPEGYWRGPKSKKAGDLHNSPDT